MIGQLIAAEYPERDERASKSDYFFSLSRCAICDSA